MSKFSGTSKFHKELQGVVAFAAYEKCCKSDAMTVTAIENNMEMLYFGDPADDDSIGLADQLVRGLGMFAGLFKEEERSTVTHSTVGGGGGDDLLRSPPPNKGTVLVMKPAPLSWRRQKDCCWWDFRHQAFYDVGRRTDGQGGKECSRKVAPRANEGGSQKLYEGFGCRPSSQQPIQELCIDWNLAIRHVF
jgi:hypothetical protein